MRQQLNKIMVICNHKQEEDYKMWPTHYKEKTSLKNCYHIKKENKTNHVNGNQWPVLLLLQLLALFIFGKKAWNRQRLYNLKFEGNCRVLVKLGLTSSSIVLSFVSFRLHRLLNYAQNASKGNLNT